MIELYHGGFEEVVFPEIRKTRYAKDFSWGFYCTKSYEQAFRWADRKSEQGVVSVYEFEYDEPLRKLSFTEMSDEWLDFIAQCRNGYVHDYDIVEGPMADDQVWDFVNEFLSGRINRQTFWDYAKFKHPTHQISFHSMKALSCLTFVRSVKIGE